MESSNLEQTLQDGKLFRHLNSLIVAHLRDNNLNQAASAVASATMTPLNVEVPANNLLELVAKGLAVKKDEMLRGVSSTGLYDLGTSIPAVYGSVSAPLTAAAIDFSSVEDTKGASKSIPKHEPRHLSEHKIPFLINLVSEHHLGRIMAARKAEERFETVEKEIKEVRV
ncbi:hypothetical protein L484_012681 [Morus notabilis]|uniref:Uncharacterized protein n=1 Tax=Morus notabilis TaxID=981085 RepID=W9QMP3_9ROSA|nr:hypothetical protein L484_012681 [Morus notabilis]